MLTKDEGRKNLPEIIDLFKKWEKDGRLENEEDVKTLIERLFEKVLGWDISDIYKERHPGPTFRRVDFKFKIDNNEKLFLEAKDINVSWAQKEYKQAIGYGWPSKVEYVALSNFKHLILFNSKWKDKDKKIFEIENIEDCLKFPDVFDRLWHLSKESFLTGEIDRVAEDHQKKWNKIPISKDLTIEKHLLNDLKNWREKLSNDIKNFNKSIPEEERDEIVQKIINRFIFIRVSEDKDLEAKPSSTLRFYLDEWKESRKSKSLLEYLFTIFHEYDKIYDSSIFTKDESCENVKIHDNVLAEIIEQLYIAEDVGAEYNFASINADILGSVYEDYLGYLLKGKKITENHAHRKEQGIYYTPTYITEYIVRNTVGELLEDKKTTPEKIKVLDPACGSGSFLIKAFDIISEAYITEEKLDKKTKNDILTKNIYGVDLDAEAAEIAKLNLFLKIEEREKLPDLENNIKNGNSLIDDEKVSDKALKWERQFKEIMDEGGFDVVIGNPPYIRIQTMKEADKEYLIEKYVSAKGKFDLYILFIERALNLLKENGYFSFIIPNKFTQTKYGMKLKEFILNNFTILKFIDFGDLKVFGDVTTYPCIIVIKKQKPTANSRGIYVKVKELSEDIENKIMQHQLLENYEDDTIKVFKFKQHDLGTDLWSFMPSNMQDIFDKINDSSKTKLIDLRERIYEGFISGNNSAFFMKAEDVEKLKIEKELIQPVPKGKNVRRYSIKWQDEFVLFPHIRNKEGIMEPVDISKYPNAERYFEKNRAELTKRKYVIQAGKKWFEIWNTRDTNWFVQDKIITPNLSSANNFSVDFKDNKSGKYFFIDHDCYGIILKDKKKDNYLYLLAILNSKLMEFFIKQKSPMFSGGYYKYHTQYLEQIPIVQSNTEIKNKIIILVNKMLSLNKQLNEIGDKKTSETKKIKDEIQKIDEEIDETVYKIYGITDEDKKIMEESLK